MKTYTGRPTLYIGRLSAMKILFAFLAVFSLSYCGKAPEEAPPSGTFKSVYSILKSHNCIECHTPQGAATVDNHVQLDFSSQELAYETLTSKFVTGATSSGICSGVKMIEAGNPTRSYLEAVLFAEYNQENFAGVTGCSPYNAHIAQFNLSTADQTSITDWIKNGALNN